MHISFNGICGTEAKWSSGLHAQSHGKFKCLRLLRDLPEASPCEQQATLRGLVTLGLFVTSAKLKKHNRRESNKATLTFHMAFKLNKSSCVFMPSRTII